MSQEHAIFPTPEPHEPPPELRLAGLLAEVRAELARRDVAWKAPPPVPSLVALPRPPVDWEHLGRLLRQPEQSADVGVTLPELRRLSAPLRWLGRLVAWGVFLVARVVTGRQRQFNHETLNYLRHLNEITRQLDTTAVEQGSLLQQSHREQHLILQQHQAMLQERLMAVARHEQDLRFHETQLGQVRTSIRNHQASLQQLQAVFQHCRERLEEQERRIQLLEAELSTSNGARRGNAA